LKLGRKKDLIKSNFFSYLAGYMLETSIVSELDSFLLLAKIKGEVVLAPLAAPSYVHARPTSSS
jgi:hypothetical protein